MEHGRGEGGRAGTDEPDLGDGRGEGRGEEDRVDRGDGGVPVAVFGGEVSPECMGGEFRRDDDG